MRAPGPTDPPPAPAPARRAGPASSGAPLAVVGDFAWDVLIRTRRELLRGGDAFGRVTLAPGGSAANVAVWARRAGAPVRFVGKIGRDRLGGLAEEDLAAEGVDARWIRSDDHATGSVAVLVDPSGERSMVSGQGADHHLLPAELPPGLLRGARHLHLSAWSFFADPPRAAARRAAALAAAAGATVSFDPGSFQMIEEMGVDRFLGVTADLGVDVLLPNAEEGRVLSGGERDPRRIADVLAERYPGALVMLKLDAEGSLVREPGGRATSVPPATDRLVDATGAGDSFAGAFLARRLAGADPVAAARFATRVSAWVIGREGARPEADGELRRLLEER